MDQRVRDVREHYHVEGTVIPLTVDGECCFLTEDRRCNVYEDRPEMCKNYMCDTKGDNDAMKSWFVRSIPCGKYMYEVTLKLERTEIAEEQ